MVSPLNLELNHYFCATSLFNRGVIVELLGREISRSRRERPHSNFACDIDHFKTINDSHGHLVGDEVLQEAARRLLLSVRSYDYVGRYGGGEFLIILNNCDPASAPRRAEEIRRALSDHPVETSIGALLVTMSWVCIRPKIGAYEPSKNSCTKWTRLCMQPKPRAGTALASPTLIFPRTHAMWFVRKRKNLYVNRKSGPSACCAIQASVCFPFS